MSILNVPRSRREALLAAAKLAGLIVAGSGMSFSLPGAIASAAESDDPRKKRFKTISEVYTLNNVYWSNWQKGASEAAEALGMQLEVQVDDQSNDKVQTIFRTAKARGFQGITFCVADPGVTQSILQMCQKDHVYATNGWSLKTWLTPFDIGDYYHSYSTPNDVAGAKALAIKLFQAMGGKGELIHISGIPGYTVAINRQLGCDLALKEFPNIKLVARQPGGDARGPTTPVINALLTAHPKVKGIFTQNDDTAMGVIAALEARGMSGPGGPLVTGIDGIPEILDAIAQGRCLATWAHHGGYMGARVTVQVFDALAGVKPSAPERMMFTGGFILDTPEAAVAYKKVMFGEGKFPWDFARMSQALYPTDWDPQNTVAPMDWEAYFERQDPRPANYQVPKAYADARASGEFDKVAQIYRANFKMDPLANIRKLCKSGGKDLV